MPRIESREKESIEQNNDQQNKRTASLNQTEHQNRTEHQIEQFQENHRKQTIQQRYQLNCDRLQISLSTRLKDTR